MQHWYLCCFQRLDLKQATQVTTALCRLWQFRTTNKKGCWESGFRCSVEQTLQKIILEIASMKISAIFKSARNIVTWSLDFVVRYPCIRFPNSGILAIKALNSSVYPHLLISLKSVAHTSLRAVIGFIWHQLCWFCLPDKESCCLPFLNEHIGVSGLWGAVLVFKWHKERDLEVCAAWFYQAGHWHSHINLHF